MATPEAARRAVDLGADLIVAQGVESGGHAGSTVSTMVLEPMVCDAMPGAPGMAAGSMADVRGARAVLALGAERAWLGTVVRQPESVLGKANLSALFLMAIPFAGSQCRLRCRALAGKSKHSRSTLVSLWG